MIKFIRKNILSQFGIPRAFVLVNGMKLVNQKVKNMLDELSIEFYNSTPSYSQCNGQAEVTNKTIMNIIKKKLEKFKGKWVEEQPNLFWAYWITPLFLGFWFWRSVYPQYETKHTTIITMQSS